MVLFLFFSSLLLTVVSGSTDEDIYDELIQNIDNDIKFLSIQLQNGMQFEPPNIVESVDQVITWSHPTIQMYGSTKSQPPKPVVRTTGSQPEKSVDVGFTWQHQPSPRFRDYTGSLPPKPEVRTTGSQAAKSADVGFTWQHQPLPRFRDYTGSLPPKPEVRPTGSQPVKSVDVGFTWQHQPLPRFRDYTGSLKYSESSWTTDGISLIHLN